MSQFPPSGQQFPGGYPNQPYGQSGQYGMPGQMPPQGYGPPPKSGGGSNVLAGVLIGCGVIFLLTVGVCGFVGYRAYQGVQSLGIEFASLIAEAAINSADGIPLEEKTRMREQVERVKKGFKDGKITLEEAGDTFTSVAESNVMKAISANGMVNSLVNHPELQPEEKKAAELTRMRIARGVIDGKIDSDRVTQAMNDVWGAFATEMHSSDADTDSESDDIEDVDVDEVNGDSADMDSFDTENQVKKVAVDKIRETLKKLDTMADEAGVAKDEAQIKIDYADEVKKIIDTKLGPKGI